MVSLVLKFGGTSLRDHPYDALNRIANATQKEKVVVVVVSALAGITDALLNRDILKLRTIFNKWRRDHHIHDSVFRTIAPLLEFCHRCKDCPDLLVSIGEKMSALLFSELLCMYAIPAAALWADVSMVQFSDGNLQCDAQRIRTCHAKKIVPVVTGYCAFDNRTQRTVLLGRNGSDTTATLIANQLHCDCAIFTDVQGIMTVDPRLCSGAFPIRNMSFDEIRELAFHGASVLHGDCIDYAEQNAEKSLTIAHVADTKWRRNGTVLSHDVLRLAQPIISAMAVLENRVGISVRAKRGVVGFACRVFQKVCEAGISVEMFSQTCSERSICLIVPQNDKTAVIDALCEYSTVRSEDLCIVTVVGESMRNSVGVAADVCSALADRGINICCISQGATEMSLSVAIPQHHLHEAVYAVHECLE